MSCAATCAIRSRLSACWASTRVDTVLHLAAQTIVGIANRNPISTFETNIAGDLGIAGSRAPRSPKVQAARRRVVRQSLWFCAARCLMSRRRRWMGEHPYDVSQVLCRPIAQSYAKTWNVPVAITRCGNFFGGGDLNWNCVVPGTIRSIIRGRAPDRAVGWEIRPRLHLRRGRGRFPPSLGGSTAAQFEVWGRGFQLCHRQAAPAFSKSWTPYARG